MTWKEKGFEVGMNEPPEIEVSIDEIIRRIKEEVKRRKTPSEQRTDQESKPLISISPTTKDRPFLRIFDRFLWRYGRKYKRIVKTVPILKDIAKKQHSRLIGQFNPFPPVAQQSLPGQLDIDVLPYYINYHGFLVQVKEQEGLKGKIKSFLFKFIKYFAWWQEQINRTLYQELMAHKAKMDERDRWVQELHQQQIDFFKRELGEQDRRVEVLNDRVALYSQARDALSRELSEQKAGMDGAQRRIEGLLHQQVDHLKGALAERDKILDELEKRLKLFGQARDELSRELSEQKAEMDGAERRIEGLLQQQVEHLKEELTERDRILGELRNQLSLYGRAKDELYQEISDQKSRIDKTGEWVESLLNQQIGGIKGELSERDKVIESLNNKLALLDRVAEELTQGLAVQKEKLDEVDKGAQNLLSQGVDNLKLEFTEVHRNLKDAMESAKKELSILPEVQSAIDHMTKEIRDHKLSILDQQRRLKALLDEAKKRFPKAMSPKQIKNILKEDDHLLDAMYVDFTERFRGLREDIKEKLKIYLPYVKQVNVGSKESPILDLACGRGEWLEVLKEEGYVAKGIEINRVMLELCRERKLDVVEAEAVGYLRKCKPNSFGAISGFHILEHLPLRVLIPLLDESYRTLKSGGLIIFETPNPTNILVSAYDFYRDPSHLNHIHPDTIIFLAELRGFVRTGAYFIEETDDRVQFVRSTEWKLDELSDYLKVSRDFVVIGYKE